MAGPHFGFSVPEPMGVVAVVAPERPVLLGLVSTVLPVDRRREHGRGHRGRRRIRATAIVFCECLATSDLPGGVVNVLTGEASEIAPHLAKHREVAAVLAFTTDPALRTSLERAATGSVKRVATAAPLDGVGWETDGQGQGLTWIERHLETKTIWHPVGV